jgi:hypothetical protein
MDLLSEEFCAGFVSLDASDVILSVEAGLPALSLMAWSDVDLTMAVVTPSGAVFCNDDASQFNPGITIDSPEQGDYTIFVGSYSPEGFGGYELYAAAGQQVWSATVFDDTASPRGGYGVLNMGGELRQALLNGALVASEQASYLPVGDVYCTGFVGLDAPDFVLTVDAPETLLSIFAASATDLTMAVRAPNGVWYCADDSSDLNPAVSISQATAGDYLVYVGAYEQFASGSYELFASVGAPSWDGLVQSMGGDTLDFIAAPAYGYLSIAPGNDMDIRQTLELVNGGSDAFGFGPGCAGYVDQTRPDFVLSVEAGLPNLTVYAVSDGDATLVVRSPSGEMLCNDDLNELHPGLALDPSAGGDYAIWVGSYGPACFAGPFLFQRRILTCG